MVASLLAADCLSTDGDMASLLLRLLCLVCVPSVTVAQAADSALALRSERKPIGLALDCTNSEGRPAVIPGDYDGALTVTEVDDRPRLLRACRAAPLPSELDVRALSSRRASTHSRRSQRRREGS